MILWAFLFASIALADVVRCQTCQTALIGHQYGLAVASNHSTTVGDTINDPSKCARQLTVDTTKCETNCTATAWVEGQYSLQGKVIVETVDSLSESSLNLTGNLDVGCCSTLTVHGNVHSNDPLSRLSIGDKSDVSLTNLQIIGNGSMVIGSKVTLTSSMGHNSITIGNNSTFNLGNAKASRNVTANLMGSDIQINSNSYVYAIDSILGSIFQVMDSQLTVSNSLVNLGSYQTYVNTSTISIADSYMDVRRLYLSSTDVSLTSADFSQTGKSFGLYNGSVVLEKDSSIDAYSATINLQNVYFHLRTGSMLNVYFVNLTNDQGQQSPIHINLGQGSRLQLGDIFAPLTNCLLVADINVPVGGYYFMQDVKNSIHCDELPSTSKATTTPIFTKPSDTSVKQPTTTTSGAVKFQLCITFVMIVRLSFLFI